MYGPECLGLYETYYAAISMMSDQNVSLPSMRLDQRRDTVHAVDVARSMIHLADWYLSSSEETIEQAKPLIFHISQETGLFPDCILLRF